MDLKTPNLKLGQRAFPIDDPRVAPLDVFVNVDIEAAGGRTCQVYFPPRHQLTYLIGQWYNVGKKSSPAAIYYGANGLIFRNENGIESDPVFVIGPDTVQVTWGTPGVVGLGKQMTFNAEIKTDAKLGLYINFPAGGQWWRTAHKD